MSRAHLTHPATRTRIIDMHQRVGKLLATIQATDYRQKWPNGIGSRKKPRCRGLAGRSLWDPGVATRIEHVQVIEDHGAPQTTKKENVVTVTRLGGQAAPGAARGCDGVVQGLPIPAILFQKKKLRRASIVRRAAAIEVK